MVDTDHMVSLVPPAEMEETDADAANSSQSTAIVHRCQRVQQTHTDSGTVTAIRTVMVLAQAVYLALVQFALLATLIQDAHGRPLR